MSNNINKTDIAWIKKEIESIKEQVYNHIPSEIKELKKEFNEFKYSNQKWLISILVSIIFLILGVLATYFK